MELEFVDLTKADDWEFIVNTIITEPERLQELAKDQAPSYLTGSNPFISCCIINSKTRGFKGGHQKNPLGFPVYLALDVPPSAIKYIGPTDIGTPFGGFGAAKVKLQFLKNASSVRASTDLRQALYQLKALQNNKGHLAYPSCPAMVRPALLADEHNFRIPVPSKDVMSRDMGLLPMYTKEGVLKDTCLNPLEKNAYSEVVVQANGLNASKDQVQPRLLLVEKRFLEQFIEKGYQAVLEKDRKSVDESLYFLANIRELTNNKLRLALIDTDLEGYKEKFPLLKQCTEILNDDQTKLKTKLTLCDARIKRCQTLNKPVPKEWVEALAVAEQEYKKFIEQQQCLLFLAQRPPRLVQALKTNSKETLRNKHLTKK